MSYSYWCMTILVMLLLMLLLRKSRFVMHRPLHVAWKIVLIRALLPTQIPSLFSIYNWVNPKFGIAEIPLVKVVHSDGIVALTHSAATVHTAMRIVHVLTFMGGLLFFIQCIAIFYKSYKIFKSSALCTEKAIEVWADEHKLLDKKSLK